MEQSSFTLDKNKDYFIQKLLELQKKREREEKDEQFNQILNDRLKIQTFKSTQKMFPDAMMKPNIEDDDESILDLHVSRVFSPPRESTSPHYHKPQHHRGEIGSSMPDFSEFPKRNPIRSFLMDKLLLTVLFDSLLLKECQHRDQYPTMLLKWLVVHGVENFLMDIRIMQLTVE